VEAGKVHHFDLKCNRINLNAKNINSMIYDLGNVIFQLNVGLAGVSYCSNQPTLQRLTLPSVMGVLT
jgi:hypothetical protein